MNIRPLKKGAARKGIRSTCSSILCVCFSPGFIYTQDGRLRCVPLWNLASIMLKGMGQKDVPFFFIFYEDVIFLGSLLDK